MTTPRPDTTLREEVATFGGVRTRTITADGDGPPRVVLLHGFADTASTWQRLQRRLAGHGVGSVAVDQPGHGEADRPDPGRPLQPQMVAFARAVAASLPAPPVVIGNSLGGAHSLLLAARHPEVLRAVVAISPAANDHPRWMTRTAEPEAMARARRARPARFVPPQVVGPMVGLVAFGNPLRVPAGMRADWSRRLSDPGFRASLRQLGMRVPQEYLGSPLPLADVKVPVLALWGDRDRLTKISSRARMEAEIDDLEFVPLPGIGHMPQTEAPGRTTKHVLAFLRRLDGQGAGRG